MRYGPFFPRISELHPRDRQMYEKLGWHAGASQLMPPRIARELLPDVVDVKELAQRLRVPPGWVTHACRCYSYGEVYGKFYSKDVIPNNRSYLNAHGRYERRTERNQSLIEAIKIADPQKQWAGTAKQARKDFWIAEDISHSDLHAALRSVYSHRPTVCGRIIFNSKPQPPPKLEVKQLKKNEDWKNGKSKSS